MLGCWCHALCHGNVSWHFSLCGRSVNPSHPTPCLLLHTSTPLFILCLLPKGTGLSHTRHKLSLLEQRACCARISWNPFPKDLLVQVQQVKPTPLQSCPALFACREASLGSSWLGSQLCCEPCTSLGVLLSEVRTQFKCSDFTINSWREGGVRVSVLPMGRSLSDLISLFPLFPRFRIRNITSC